MFSLAKFVLFSVICVGNIGGVARMMEYADFLPPSLERTYALELLSNKLD